MEMPQVAKILNEVLATCGKNFIGICFLEFCTLLPTILGLKTVYKITVSPWPFSDQNIGLNDQTCSHLTICANQIFK